MFGCLGTLLRCRGHRDAAGCRQPACRDPVTLLMALSVRICLFTLCLLLAPAAAAAGTSKRPAVPVVANPAPLLPAPKPRRKITLGQRAVRIAAEELGVPYRYGGSSPSGFDCSGLVAYVYARLGISLPHNAAAQYGYGRAVDTAHLRPGDLVFFHGLGHVGLYIGRGRFIHAPRSGERVSIQSMASRAGTVDGARRVS
jgi:cell wall-associated NlpC family hydrolase